MALLPMAAPLSGRAEAEIPLGIDDKERYVIELGGVKDIEVRMDGMVVTFTAEEIWNELIKI